MNLRPDAPKAPALPTALHSDMNACLSRLSFPWLCGQGFAPCMIDPFWSCRYVYPLTCTTIQSAPLFPLRLPIPPPRNIARLSEPPTRLHSVYAIPTVLGRQPYLFRAVTPWRNGHFNVFLLPFGGDDPARTDDRPLMRRLL